MNNILKDIQVDKEKNLTKYKNINLYYIDELIPSSKKFCSIYFPHQ